MTRTTPERERLTQLIHQWNVDHYDLFELSKPNEDLEFHGVVRFYFQGGDGANVITKCIRVSSTATSRDVIETLIEKFRPDMRMLTQNKYALYEVHVNGEERRLQEGEKPLWVQLNWGKDVREGRFLLKNEDEKTIRDPALGFTDKEEGPNFKRKLSKREKKEKKKREQEQANQHDSVASKLYSDAPETSFTRSISNPEAVMRRRRQQKLEKKLAQMQSREGGPDSGGTLKIYGESLQPDVPYKTLLLSTADTTTAVVKEAMEKYGLEKEDPEQFCLVEVLLPPGSLEYHGGTVGDERVLDDSECPLAIVMQHSKNRGHIIFQLRRRSADYKKRSKRTRAVSQDDLRKAHEQPATQVDKLPYLIEINPLDGKPRKHLLPLNVTEVVRDRPMTPGNQFLQLSGPDIKPRHCVIAHTEGIVTVTPTAPDAEIYVDQQPVRETTMLRHGMTIRFGRNHVYRFVDPRFEEVSKHTHGHPVASPRTVTTQETNFDIDGHVETVPAGQGTQSHSRPRDPRDRDIPQRSSGNQVFATNGHDLPPDLLPTSLEFRLEVEDRLLQAVILDVNSRAVQFKLAPTYTLYMIARRLLAMRTQIQLLPAHHSHILADFVSKTSKLIQQAIQEHHNDPTALAFWMANASEVLHFFKQDADIQPFGSDSQELLAEAVQMAFHHLVRCLQGDLQRVMPAFLDSSDMVDDENAPHDQFAQDRPVLADVLNTLSAAMTLLRRCRVNAALTIQLFSQLFHFINMWLFNILVMEPQLQLCTRAWGIRLKRRLGRVEAWAEKQGLELAADCHLCRIIQAAHLLQAPKMTSDDITNISSTCFKLNSLQLQALLAQYMPEPGEPPVSMNFIERIVVIAENMADELTRTDGREVRLEEDPDLHLPFLLPEDGYSCDTIRGIPTGLPEFVTQLSNAGLCQMVANSKASGSWTVYMGGPFQSEPSRSSQGNQPEMLTVCFKKVKGSMGLSIVAAIGEGLQERGIYIKSVVPGGAAALDGRLKAGDQLLEVDGKSLIGLSQDKAAELMTQTGDTVTLRVAKQGAIYHGLATLLNEPSPTAQRHATRGGPIGHNGVPAGHSNLRMEEGPPPYMDSSHSSLNDTQRGFNSQKPVPQPRGQINSLGRDGSDRTRAPSTGNLSNAQYNQQQEPSNLKSRDIDPRSKSTSNLHVNTSFDRSEPPNSMRGAASVGMLHPSLPGQQQYLSGGHRTDVRPNDYVNQPHVSPGGYQDGNQNLKQGSSMQPPPSTQQLNSVGYRPSDRSSVSSKASSNSARDTRPQSAYYDAQPPKDDRNSYVSRPKSDEVTANKLREWQDKFEPPGQSNRRNGAATHSPPYANQNYKGSDPNQNLPPSNQNQGHQGSDIANHSPPYTNIGTVTHNRTQASAEPRPSAHQRLFGSQAGGPSSTTGTNKLMKVTQPNQPQQPNVYENTRPAAPESGLVFHQPNRPPIESDRSKPSILPKPAIQAKKQPKVQHTNNHMDAVDNRQASSNFYTHQPQAGGPHIGRPDTTDLRSRQDPRMLQDPRVMQNDPSFTQQPDPRVMQQDPRTIQQDTRPIQQDSRTIQLDTRPIQQDPRTMQQDPRTVQQDTKPNQQDPRVTQQDPRIHLDNRAVQQDPRPGYSMQKFPSLRGDPGPYGYPVNQPNVPLSSVHDLPPELPPPPVEQEELPPLPPPPPLQDMYEQQLHDEQRRLMESMSGSGVNQPPNISNSYDRYTQSSNYNGFAYGNGIESDPRSGKILKSQERVQGPSYHSYQQQQLNSNAPNYQNVSFAPEVRMDSGPSANISLPISQLPPDHNVYEHYDSRNQSLPSQQHLRPGQSFDSKQPVFQQERLAPPPLQQQQVPQQTPVTSGGFSSRSAWDREEKEKAEEMQEEELFRAREAEIIELESKSYLSMPEQERLRKLKLEHEFQRRVKEIDEKGDFEADDDDEMTERLFTRERLIQSLKDDLEKSQQRIDDLDHQQMIQDAQREKERMQRLERRLEMMEKDRQEMRERMEKRQQRRQSSHQEQLKLQREAREKQRQNYEEQKRLMVLEEEKMRLRREEELAKKRQMERERLQEMQIARDKEEERLRAEIRRQNDDYISQQMLQQRAQRLDQNREIRVSDERRRLESANSGSGSQPVNGQLINGPVGMKGNASMPGYQQYMNLPPQQVVPEKENLAPAPPERKSSYNTNITRNNPDYTTLSFHAQPQPQQQLNPPAPTKKTVKFNTNMNTYQERTPSHSFSSEHNLSPLDDQALPSPSEVFHSPVNRQPPSFTFQESTPSVIGTQEVYRDPRSRIEAEKAALNPLKKPGVERMSFRDKLKLFAQEAGEDAPKYKPKASKTLRNIESQLNGQ